MASNLETLELPSGYDKATTMATFMALLPNANLPKSDDPIIPPSLGPFTELGEC